MENSLRASEVGLEKVDQARRRRGWNRQSTVWAQTALTSVASLKLFWRGERLGYETFVRICQAVGIEDWQQVAALPETTAEGRLEALGSSVDWGDAPEVTSFYGRDRELAMLQTWVVGDRAKLVAILGMGGMGKTTLAVRLVESLAVQEGRLVWRSLRNAPTPEAVLRDLLTVFTGRRGEAVGPEPIAPVGAGLAGVLDQVLHFMQRQRWLLILDNAESVLAEGGTTYRPGYEGYGEWLQRVGQERHQSCVIVTSRELPRVGRLCLDDRVRLLTLGGLDPEPAQQLLTTAEALPLDPAALQRLVNYYGGNPLALRIVGARLQELGVDGPDPLLTLMATGDVAFSDIQSLLDQQLARLTPLETSVMQWLALLRDPISLESLRTLLVSPDDRRHLPETLIALKRRSLIDPCPQGFVLQPVVLEHLLRSIVTQIIQEIQTQTPNLLCSHALLQATARDDIRTAQRRLVLHPILDRLLATLPPGPPGREALRHQTLTLLAPYHPPHPLPPPSTHPPIHPSTPHPPAYLAGNLLNLLLEANLDLSHANFSALPIWQADLRDRHLPAVNFSHCPFRDTRFTETFSRVLSVAFSPDGSLLAQGDERGWLRLWRSPDYEPLPPIKAHEGWTFGLAFSPDGQTLISGGIDRLIKLWDLTSGECLRTLNVHTGAIAAIQIGRWNNRPLIASASADQTIQLTDLTTGQPLHSLHGHQGIIRALAFSPDGQTLVSASLDRTLRRWDLQTGNCLHLLPTATTCHALCFTADGQLFSAGEDGQIHLWDLDRSQIQHTLSGHHQPLWAIALSPDNQTLISAGDDQTIKLWNLKHWPDQPAPTPQTLSGHQGRIWSLSLHPNTTSFASSSDDRTVRLWQLPQGHSSQTLQGYYNSLWPIALQQTNIASGGTLRVPPDAIARSTLLTYSTTQTLQTWTLDPTYRQAQLSHSRPLPTGTLMGLTLSPDGTTLVYGQLDGTIAWVDCQTGTLQRQISAHRAWVRHVSFSPDGHWLGSASGDYTAKIWDVLSGDCTQVLEGHDNPVHDIQFHPSIPLVVTCSWDRTLRFWDLETGATLSRLVGHTAWISSLALTPDGQYVISGSWDGTIRIWQVPTGDCVEVWDLESEGVEAIALSPTGQYLASLHPQGILRLWDLATGRCLHRLQNPAESEQPPLFSPDGQFLICGTEAGSCVFWEVETGKLGQVLQVPRPYEGMKITGITGLTETQRVTLQELGAIG